MTKLSTQQIRFKIFWVSLGLVAGTGLAAISQVCPAPGQCAACGGACLARLPLLAIPLAAGPLIALTRKEDNQPAEEMDGANFPG